MTENVRVFEVEIDDSIQKDMDYFRQKFVTASLSQDSIAAEKAYKQLELLEDAVVIYKLSHGEGKL